jgi:hypothetical protein
MIKILKIIVFIIKYMKDKKNVEEKYYNNNC